MKPSGPGPVFIGRLLITDSVSLLELVYLDFLSLHDSIYVFQFSSVQLLICVWLFATPWTVARKASLSFTNSWSPPKPMSIESVTPSSHLILCCPLLFLPSIFPSIRVFSNESALLIRWPKYWEFQLQHQSYQWTPRTDHLHVYCGYFLFLALSQLNSWFISEEIVPCVAMQSVYPYRRKLQDTPLLSSWLTPSDSPLNQIDHYWIGS